MEIEAKKGFSSPFSHRNMKKHGHHLCQIVDNLVLFSPLDYPMYLTAGVPKPRAVDL